jgi:CRP-like cAMP-binding protein
MIEAQDLRGIAVFSDLPDEQLAWLATQGDDIHAQPGEILFREGDPAEHMYVFFEGEFQGRNERVSDGRIFTAQAGDVTGLLPFSRLQIFQGTGRAVTRVRVGRFH